MTVQATSSTWHTGERAAQARAGTAAHMAKIGPMVVRDFMPDQHRLFFAQLPWIFAGVLDARGWPLATVLTVAIPVGIFLGLIYALYYYLVRRFDPFHVWLLTATAAVGCSGCPASPSGRGCLLRSRRRRRPLPPGSAPGGA